MRINRVIKAAIFISLMLLVAATAPVVYVQTPKASIKSKPTFGSKTIATAVKGSRFNVIQKKGRWYKISFNRGKTGWVSAIHVSTRPPLKRISILGRAKKDISKQARRRASVVTLTAAARGLAEDDRRRLGGDKAHADYDSLERIEAVKITEAEIDAFIKQTE
jgi:hypothetical protein